MSTVLKQRKIRSPLGTTNVVMMKYRKRLYQVTRREKDRTGPGAHARLVTTVPSSVSGIFRIRRSYIVNSDCCFEGWRLGLLFYEAPDNVVFPLNVGLLKN